jgi:tryptophanyl-tRNA synthetase
MAKNLKRILTGVQSTGVPHMGNILGAILPAINFSKQKEIESYLFIADFHSLTQIKDSKTLKENTLYTAGSLVSFWIGSKKNDFLSSK